MALGDGCGGTKRAATAGDCPLASSCLTPAAGLGDGANPDTLRALSRCGKFIAPPATPFGAAVRGPRVPFTADSDGVPAAGVPLRGAGDAVVFPREPPTCIVIFLGPVGAVAS